MNNNRKTNRILMPINNENTFTPEGINKCTPLQTQIPTKTILRYPSNLIPTPSSKSS